MGLIGVGASEISSADGKVQQDKFPPNELMHMPAPRCSRRASVRRMATRCWRGSSEPGAADSRRCNAIFAVTACIKSCHLSNQLRVAEGLGPLCPVVACVSSRGAQR